MIRKITKEIVRDIGITDDNGDIIYARIDKEGIAFKNGKTQWRAIKHKLAWRDLVDAFESELDIDDEDSDE